MTATLQTVRNFVRDEEGASMVEYALLVALIAVVVIVAVTTIGTRANDKLGDPGLAGALS
jgi:pilus assembly protein Flp/PilA